MVRATLDPHSEMKTTGILDKARPSCAEETRRRVPCLGSMSQFPNKFDGRTHKSDNPVKRQIRKKSLDPIKTCCSGSDDKD